MSEPSWILAEIVGAVCKGLKKRPTFHHVWQRVCVGVCVYVYVSVFVYTLPGQRAKAGTLRGRLGGWERDPVSNVCVRVRTCACVYMCV